MKRCSHAEYATNGKGGEASRWGLRFRDMNKIQEISPHSGLLHEIHVYITISKASLFIFYCLNDKAPPTERDSLYHCHFHHSMSPYTYPFQLPPRPCLQSCNSHSARNIIASIIILLCWVHIQQTKHTSQDPIARTPQKNLYAQPSPANSNPLHPA